MASRSSLSRVGQAADPAAALDAATKQYVDAQLAALLGVAPTDLANYGDQFASVYRPIATSQDTLSTGFLSFTGGKAVRASSTPATKLRFHCRGVAPAGAVVTMNLHKGSSTTNLPKVGADFTVTTNFSAIGYKEITIPTSFSWNVGDYLYLSILRTGTGTPDPAMATTGGPANNDLFNPDSTHFITGYKGSQSSIPNPLDTSAAFTGSGRIFWWSLA